jgi:hypothetical protein
MNVVEDLLEKERLQRERIENFKSWFNTEFEKLDKKSVGSLNGFIDQTESKAEELGFDKNHLEVTGAYLNENNEIYEGDNFISIEYMANDYNDNGHILTINF